VSASGSAGASTGSPPVALVHDSHRYDGHRVLFRHYLEALRATGRPVSAYTCVDPSSAADFAIDGTAIRGRRWPGGGRVEMAINRLGRHLAREVAAVPARPLHLMSVHLARVIEERPDVALSLIDLAKLNTRWYPRTARILHNWLLRRAPRARAIVTATEWVRQDVVRSLGIGDDRVVVAPPFAEVEPAPSMPPPTTTEAAPRHLVYVAVDRPHKNVGAFFDIVERLGPGYRGTWVGVPRPATARDLARRRLGARLAVVPASDELDGLYRSADVLVHPSHYEGFGLPILEAMARGVPVVASTATCLPEVVGSGGLTVRLGDLDGWCEAVRRLCDPATNPGARAAARARAATFTKIRTATALERAYELATA